MALREKIEDMIQKIFAKQMEKFLQKTGASLTDAKVPVVGSDATGNPLFNLSSIGSADLSKLSGANALDGTIAEAISGLITSLTQKGNLYNTNIDDITVFGVYRLGDGNTSSGDHIPNWGALIVLDMNVHDGLYQIHITQGGTNGVYIRNYDTQPEESWGLWYKV